MCEHGTTELVRIKGGTRAGVDACIAPLVRALNNGGIKTLASCCGHGNRPGNIVLGDGRELVIAPDFKTARQVDAAFPDIWGEPSPRDTSVPETPAPSEGWTRRSVTDVAHAIYENCDPTMGAPGMVADGGCSTDDWPMWGDLTDAQRAWYEQMVVDCVTHAGGDDLRQVPRSAVEAIVASPSGAAAPDWKPTSGNINALPEPLRRYVHDLETRCDPSGEVRTIGELRDTVAALEAEVLELRAAAPQSEREERLRAALEEIELIRLVTAGYVEEAGQKAKAMARRALDGEGV